MLAIIDSIHYEFNLISKENINKKVEVNIILWYNIYTKILETLFETNYNGGCYENNS